MYKEEMKMTIHTNVSHETIDELFSSGTAIIFKHSTRCPVSAAAKREIEKYSERNTAKIPIYIVDVITKRIESDHIEKKTGIQHQSPQVFVINKGSVVYTASHWEIDAEIIKTVTDKL